MPELPEVETVRRGLGKFILKKKLVRVRVLCEKSFVGDANIHGEVVGLRRFGKALVIDLAGGVSLMVHLRMTGQLIFDENGSGSGLKRSGRFAAGHPSENFVDKLPNKQTRVILEFENGTLYFNDQRKFGFIKVMTTDEVLRDKFIAGLAPEPWVMETADFCGRLKRHQGAPIKAVILDQKIICGLGNIYADEALFVAGIHPERKAGSLSADEARGLLESARMVMEKAIDAGGSTMATYVKADGTRGDYLDKFAQVFNRTGEPCVRCGEKIVKIRVAGRGTHICQRCQK